MNEMIVKIACFWSCSTLDGIFTIQPLTCIICVIITRGAHYRFLFGEYPRAGYDDFKVYGKKIYIKRSCSLVFCHHFLYYKLPEIVLPKHGILRFKLTKILWHLLWRVFWWSGDDRRIKTNNILVKFSTQFEEKNSMLWQNNFR